VLTAALPTAMAGLFTGEIRGTALQNTGSTALQAALQRATILRDRALFVGSAGGAAWIGLTAL